MERSMKLTVVVCTYNRSEILKYCLDSLAKQSIEKSLFEVIVVDNNSTDNTKEVVQEYCRNNNNFRYVLEEEQGHSQARNRGWKEAEGEFVAYIDDDAYANEKWIESIIKCFLETNADIVGGKISPYYLENEKMLPEWIKNFHGHGSWGEKRRKIEYPENKFGFSAGNVAFRKAVFEEVGGFSTEFGIVNNKLVMGEDSELGLRLSRAQKSFWYEPESEVKHLVGKDLLSCKGIVKRSWKSGYGMGYIMAKHFGSYYFIKRCFSVPCYFSTFLFFIIICHKLFFFKYFNNFVYSISVCFSFVKRRAT